MKVFAVSDQGSEKAPFHFKIVPLDCELLVDSHNSTIPSQAEALASRHGDFHTFNTFKPPTNADLLSLCKQVYRFYRNVSSTKSIRLWATLPPFRTKSETKAVKKVTPTPYAVS